MNVHIIINHPAIPGVDAKVMQRVLPKAADVTGTQIGSYKNIDYK